MRTKLASVAVSTRAVALGEALDGASFAERKSVLCQQLDLPSATSDFARWGWCARHLVGCFGNLNPDISALLFAEFQPGHTASGFTELLIGILFDRGGEEVLLQVFVFLIGASPVTVAQARGLVGEARESARCGCPTIPSWRSRRRWAPGSGGG